MEEISGKDDHKVHFLMIAGFVTRPLTPPSTMFKILSSMKDCLWDIYPVLK